MSIKPSGQCTTMEAKAVAEIFEDELYQGIGNEPRLFAAQTAQHLRGVGRAPALVAAAHEQTILVHRAHITRIEMAPKLLHQRVAVRMLDNGVRAVGDPVTGVEQLRRGDDVLE